MNSYGNISPEQLRRAADIKEKIESLNAELTRILRQGGLSGEATTEISERQMSAAGRARISAAAKRRWALFRASRGLSANRAKAGRKMSAAGRAAISAAAKARWAKAKAAGRNRL